MNTTNVTSSASASVLLFLAGTEFATDASFLAELDAAFAKPSPIEGEKSSRKGKGKGSLRERDGEAKKKNEGFKILIQATGSLTATSFLVALREAGLRPILDEAGEPRVSEVTGEVLMHCDPSAEREDQKLALIGFAGWTNEAHGTQLDRAVNHARFSLLPKRGISLPHRSWEKRQAKASISAAGFVSGLPHFAEKMLQDLAARERLAVEELATASALVDCLGKPATETSAPIDADPVRFERMLTKMTQDDEQLVAAIRGTKNLPKLLNMMVVCAEGALVQIREDIDSLDGSNLTVEAIDRCHRVLAARGAPLLVERIALQGEMAVE